MPWKLTRTPHRRAAQRAREALLHQSLELAALHADILEAYAGDPTELVGLQALRDVERAQWLLGRSINAVTDALGGVDGRVALVVLPGGRDS